ncbi:MAG TPA: CDP-diacylglycerol--glycerol-3-phosphate 3-phosphatidyltransferase [Candidatus Latescibacteria bacterium]|nr:CDP-diacylglycerol--glycerol-3-phosphate 3-phosphatidyltransferase [Candidatus Latescibacterota bacterium]
MEPSNTLRNEGLHLPRSNDSGRIMTMPNVLTAIRILLTPVFLLLIFSESWYCKILALLVFTIASLTDFYDGRIARRDKTITSLGRFLDPLADKLLVSSALISFVILGMVEAWLVGAMLMRDMVITCLRVYIMRKGRQVVTSRLAKWKTMLQLVLAFGILVFINVRVIQAEITSQPLVLVDSWSHVVVNILVAAVTLVTILSGLRYLVDQYRRGA